MFIPDTGKRCILPNLPDDRRRHTINGLVVCGGGRCDYGDTCTSCLTFTSGRWIKSHTLLHDRYDHTSWMSEEGLVLIGGQNIVEGDRVSGKNSDSTTTTELLQGNHSVPYFDLKYRTRYIFA